MSDKSETCGMCEGQGVTGIAGYLCDRCNGTGISTTGEVVGALPSTPDPVTDEPLPSQVPTITVTHNGAATPPFPDRYFRVEPWTPAGAIERANTTIAEQAAEIERLKAELHEAYTDDATGDVDKSEDNPSPETDVSAMNVPVAVDNIEDKLRLARAEVERLATVYADHSATIAEQSAEIERLIRVHGEQMETIAAQSGTITGLRTTERDLMRELKDLNFEVQRLKDLSFEQDRTYAALEAERDGLKDEARKLKDDWNELGVDLIDTRNRLRDSTVCLDAANTRAEKYLRVIEAKDATLHALLKLHNAAMHSASITASAGLPVYYSETREKESHE